MKIYLSHSAGFDYHNELYAPIRNGLSKDYDITFPHESEARVNSKEAILGSAVVLAEISFPSTGQGVELGWADASGIPILCFHRTDSIASRSLRFITEEFIEYEDRDDMVDKLKDWLEAR